MKEINELEFKIFLANLKIKDLCDLLEIKEQMYYLKKLTEIKELLK